MGMLMPIIESDYFILIINKRELPSAEDNGLLIWILPSSGFLVGLSVIALNLLRPKWQPSELSKSINNYVIVSGISNLL